MDQQRGHRRGGHPLDRAVPDGVIVPQEEKDAYDNASPAERKDILQGFADLGNQRINEMPMDMGSSKTGHKSDGMTRMQRDSIAREQFMKKDDPVQTHSEGTATVSDPNGWASLEIVNDPTTAGVKEIKPDAYRDNLDFNNHPSTRGNESSQRGGSATRGGHQQGSRRRGDVRQATASRSDPVSRQQHSDMDTLAVHPTSSYGYQRAKANAGASKKGSKSYHRFHNDDDEDDVEYDNSKRLSPYSEHGTFPALGHGNSEGSVVSDRHQNPVGRKDFQYSSGNKKLPAAWTDRPVNTYNLAGPNDFFGHLKESRPMSATGNDLTVMAASTAYSPHSRQNDGSGSTRGVSGQSAMHNHGNRHSSGRPDLEEQVRSADNMGKRQHRVLKSGSAERTIDDPFWMLSADQRDTVSKVPRDAQAGVIKAFLDDNARANAGFLDDITDTSGHDVVTAGVYEEEFQADSIATASFDDDDLAGNTQPALFSLIDSDPGHDVATARVHEEEFQGECIVKLPPPSLATWYPPLWYWEKLLPKDVPELHSNEIFSRGKTPDFPRNGFLSSFFIKFPGIDRCTKVLRSKRVTDKAVQTAESTGITNTSSKDGNLSENTQPGLVSLMDSDFGLGGSSFVDYSGLEEHADRGHFPFADSEDLVQLATTRQPNIYSLNDLLGLSFSPVKTTANADVESGVPIKLLDFVIDAERAEKDVTDVSTAHPAVPLKSEDATSRKLLGYPSPRNTDKKRLSRKDALLSLAEHDFALTERNVNLQKDEELAEKYDDNNDVRQENQKPTTISEAESTKTSETSRIQYTADELRALEPSIQTKLFIPYELRDFLVPQSTAPKAPQREGHLAQFDVERSMKARIGMKASTHASDDDDAAAGAVMDSGKPSFKNQFSGSTLGRSDNTSWTPTVWGDTDTAPPQLSTSMAVLEPELKVEVPVAKPPPSTAKGIQASFWASSDENEKPKPATIVPKAEAEVTLPAMGVAMKSEPKPVVVKKGIMDSIWASGSDGDKLKRSATVEATVEVGTPKAEVKVPTPKSALTLIHSHIASNQSPPAYIVPKVSTSPFQPQTYVVPNLDPHPSSFTDTATALRHYALTGQYLTHEDLTYIFGQLTVRSAGSVTALPTSAAFESVVKKSKAISIVDLKTYKPVNTITGPVRIASGLSPAAPVFRPLAQPFTPSTPVLSPAAPVFTPAIPPRTSSEYAITTPQAMNLEPKKPEHRITITVRGVPGMQLVDYAVLSEDQFIVTDALIQLRSRASAREFFSGK